MASDLLWELRVAVRALSRARLVSVPAIITLGLASGATTAVFAVVNSLLLRPLPVPSPDRLVAVSSDFAITNGFKAGAGWSYAMWESLRQRAAPFAGVLAWKGQRFTIGGAGETQPAGGLYVSGGFFATLGVRAEIGRLFTAEDDRQDAGGVMVVISHRLWQRQFARDANVRGRTLIVDGVPATIVGVTPEAFVGLEAGSSFDVALPITAEPSIRGRSASLLTPRAFLLLVMLRLRDGQSIEAATRALRTLQPEIVPATAPAFVKEPFVLVPVAEASTPGNAQEVYRRPLLFGLTGVGIVLLISCANIANLLLARAASRQREFGVRGALGANRWQIALSPLIEGLLLAGAGAAFGLAIARPAARAIVALSPVSLQPVLDWRVAAFAGLLATVTVVVCGLAPAVRATRTPPMRALRMSGVDTAGGRGHLSNGLVVVQIAMTIVVVVAAGLLNRTFLHLARVPLGFDADRVLVIEIDTARSTLSSVSTPSTPSTTKGADRTYPYERVVTAIAGLPGVAGAAASAWTPLRGEGGFAGLRLPEASPDSPAVNVLINFITPGWLGVYGTALEAGRDFSDGDSAAAATVVMVNRAFARTLLPRRNPVGAMTTDNRMIVGLVHDAVYRTTQRIPGVTSTALRESIPPTIYAPLAQIARWDRPPSAAIRVSVRAATGNPAALAPSIGAALTAADPDLRFQFRLLDEDVAASLAVERMSAAASAVFAILALLLAMVGLYGVTSYAVARRTAEMALRIALGARRSEVLRLVLRRALVSAAAGIAVGIIGAVALTRFVSSMLFGITPLDPSTLLGVSAIVAAVAVAAAFVPAYRASRVDPLVTLRTE